MPSVANVYPDKVDELKVKKAKELINSSQTETVPKPVAATAGENDCRGRRKREKEKVGGGEPDSDGRIVACLISGHD